MKVISAPLSHSQHSHDSSSLRIVLFGRSLDSAVGSVGATVKETIQRAKLDIAPRSWDLLSIALSVIAADTACSREKSPDGWTRQIELEIAVREREFWETQRRLLEEQLRFLTTDIWSIEFLDGGDLTQANKRQAEDCVVLLSGGLDSLIGSLDLKEGGNAPIAVSQVSRGDGDKQRQFASQIGQGINHVQLNHNATCPGDPERSQRARSFLFLTYGVLIGTSLQRYHDGDESPLYVCENGFISINPPLSEARLGSLSTRTTHPVFIELFRTLLKNADLRIDIRNPYQFKTKGEMLIDCAAQHFLHQSAHISTSCGKFARNGYKHCGRCLPCLIRRAAFARWGEQDNTEYVYHDLSLDDAYHARFDDVRSAAMAVMEAQDIGLRAWIGQSLSSTRINGSIEAYEQVVGRGLEELAQYLRAVGVM